jgi:hypothetical protein
MTNLLVGNISDYFTPSITQAEILDDVSLARLLERILTSLHQREMQITSIFCDGASYELKALDFQDSASIQARNSANSLFPRLLDILCLCYRLNSASNYLIHQSPLLKEVID